MNFGLGNFNLPPVSVVCMRIRVDGLSQAAHWNSMTIPLSSEMHLSGRGAVPDDEAVDICHGSSFLVVLLIGLIECNCQGLPP